MTGTIEEQVSSIAMWYCYFPFNYSVMYSLINFCWQMYQLQVFKEGEIKELTSISKQKQKNHFSEEEKLISLKLGNRDVCQTLQRLGATTRHNEILDMVRSMAEVQGIVDHATIYSPGRDAFGFPTPASWSIPDVRGLKEKYRALSLSVSGASKRHKSHSSSARKRGKG
jgi:hypothetical protein